MAYVVYVNYPTNKANVHSQQCRCYQNRKSDRTDNGHWSKLFTDQKSAEDFAQSTRKKTVGSCKFCCSNKQ